MGQEEGEGGVCDEPDGGVELGGVVVAVVVEGWSSYRGL